MSDHPQKKVTIIVPVYADWPSLADCIDSLSKYVDSRHKIMLVNDCGPDADKLEEEIIKSIENLSNFEYHRNSKNIGFLKTCNRAVNNLDKTENDILLLNSDTEVTEGFLEELINVLYSSDKIGVASPRTNNATIATIPLSTMRQKGIDLKKSYKLFLEKKAELPRYNLVPTAHGFCILIRRSLIKKYGLFDKIFGKGYGEEVDFCMRIKKHGYQSVLSNRSYVFHHEARSFTMEAKLPLLESSSKIINDRYPGYSKLVKEYIKSALIREEGIYPEAVQKPHRFKNHVKKLVKRNKKIHRLAQILNSKAKKEKT